MSIRVVIADDESLMRSGLKLLLGAATDIEVIAEAVDGVEAIDLARRLSPDLVLMDIRMPRLDGLEAAQTLLSDPEHPQVLMLTAFGTDDFIHRALQSGAAGYILKDTPPEELINAVRAAADGTRTLSETALATLMSSRPAASAPGRDPLVSLSTREREIAEAVAQGLTNAQVARALFVSTATVKTHLARIFDKLEVTSRVQLALLVNAHR
ncbi:DNA-binding response regulator [Brevibacterium permense]|uniref:response regulator n=1 Tax=Brevibacterium permense TaxID=234834 RepID=UPI0021D004DA|nr:response regulator transcription factor [Brevibacterium permense]MCU4295626.1 DNA-binding response regulator [Brevibacterium permense]